MQKQAVSRNSFFSMKALAHRALSQQVVELAPFLTEVANKWVRDPHARPTTETDKAVVSVLQKLQLASRNLVGSVGYKLC